MEKGKVELYIHETLRTKGAMLFGLIDPMDYDGNGDAVKTAKQMVDGGLDVILLAGSTEVQGELLDTVAKSIKEAIDVPLILFPGNIATITRYADAIYFQALLNARSTYWMTQAQMLAATTIKRLKIEPLPVGYIIVHPGGTAGWVGDANLIPREKPKIAAALAMAGEFLGKRFILTDTGSNPRAYGYGHMPLEMIRAVKSAITVPYIVGGGVTTAQELKNVFSAGADIVQIGTIFQGTGQMLKRAQAFSKIVKEAGAKKLKKQ